MNLLVAEIQDVSVGGLGCSSMLVALASFAQAENIHVGNLISDATYYFEVKSISDIPPEREDEFFEWLEGYGAQCRQDRVIDLVARASKSATVREVQVLEKAVERLEDSLSEIRGALNRLGGQNGGHGF